MVGLQAQALHIPAGGSAMPASHISVESNMHFVQMTGQDVFKYAVRALSSASATAIEANGITKDEIRWVIPHQANLRISEAVQKSLKLRDDQVYNNIMRYGNTTSATIPIALDECVRSGRLKRGDLLVVTAFGWGFMWGSCVIRW